jgi:type IV secretory pathway VirB2 component (pilin)
MHKTIVLIFLQIVSVSAWAAAGDDAITEMLQALNEWLTGDVAIIAGTVAFIAVGFQTLRGKLALSMAMNIFIGLGLIFGAAFLAGLVAE